MNPPPPFWQGLFALDSTMRPTTVVTMKLLTKRGRPLLLLPKQPRLARHALDLYPAQTTRGRLARLTAHWLLKSRLPFRANVVQVSLSLEHSFVRWLAQLAKAPPNQIPPFAILAGNPNSPGQRFIILLFNSAGQPAAIVKAGLTDTARELIRQEQQFLEQVQLTFPGLPAPRGNFSNEQLNALALDFQPGRSPRAQDERALPRVLNQWLHPRDLVGFGETRVGRELAVTCAGHPAFPLNASRLQGRSYRATLFHGDFTPWNIRVSPSGEWTALDWERGEMNGLPAWDWFHYVIQKGILVQHQTAESLATTVESLLAREEFTTYARASGIIGDERALLLLYLLHHSEVVRPSEGLQATLDLLRLLTARWR